MKTLKLVAIAFFLVITLNFCSNSNKETKSNNEDTTAISKDTPTPAPEKSLIPPTDEEVNTAITEFLKGFYFISNTDNDHKVDKVRIEKRGDYNSESKYWPIRAYFKVFYTSNFHKYFQEKTGDFKLSLNDYKEWKADLIDKNRYK